MSSNLKNTDSIGNQILGLVTKTTMLAVLVVSVTQIVLHVFSARESKISQTYAIAEVVAKNSTAAVSFDESDIATELLESLGSRPTITYAAIVDGNGELFASYSRNPDLPFQLPADISPGTSMRSGELEVRVPINEFDQPIGTLIVKSTTDDIRASVLRFIWTSCLISVMVLAIGIWLAARLQKTISRPIMDLSQTAQEISGKGDYSLRVENRFKGEIGILCQHFNEMLQQIEQANLSLNQAHGKLVHSNEVLEDNVQTRTEELATTNEKLRQEIEDKKRANQELKDLQCQMIDTSRQAGMAEIANGVLHNVGNVLNSVNISATLISEKIKGMRLDSLTKASELLNQHKADLAEFFATNDRAGHLPKFMENMVKHLVTTRDSTVSEVKSLNKNVGFIKDVIQAQQSFAGNNGMISTVKTDEIFDDALKFVSSSFERHSVEVEKNYEVITQLDIDKSKLLQILTNYIKNAREAVAGISDRPKIVRLKISISGASMVEFSVTDNGIGIAEEHIARIFTHGFTTKEHGHGFGLHSSAIAAKEMKGSVRVQSEGLGRGSTFSVIVPSRPAKVGFPEVEMRSGMTTPVDKF